MLYEGLILTNIKYNSQCKNRVSEASPWRALGYGFLYGSTSCQLSAHDQRPGWDIISMALG